MSKTRIKVYVPLIMLLVVVGIWYVKNSQVEQPLIVGEFALDATNIDLDEIKSHQLPIIIDFGADECAPCVAMAPVLVKVNSEMQGKAVIKFVDVWKNPDSAKNFPVQVIPTQVFYNADGTPYKPSKELGIEFLYYGSKSVEGHVYTVHQGGLTEEQMLAILEDMGVK